MFFHVYKPDYPAWLYLKLKDVFSQYPSVCKIILKYELIDKKDLSSWRTLQSTQKAIDLIILNAITKNNLEALRELAKAGLDLLASDELLNESPIFWAVEKEATEIVRYLLDQGADVNDKDITGATLLHKAVISGNLETARLLTDRGAMLDLYEDIDNRTPLGIAIAERNLEMVQFLIDAGADTENEDYLSLAAHSGSIPIFDFFQKRVKNPYEYENVFEYAVCGGNLNMVFYLLELEEVPVKDPCLLDVLQSGNFKLFKFLLSPEFAKHLGHSVFWDPHTPNAVSAAIYGGNRRLLQWVLEGGGDPNEQTEYTDSPLFNIGISNRPFLVDMLIKFGADPNKKNRKGETPIERALKSRNYSLALQLFEASTDPKRIDQNNDTPLTSLKNIRLILPIVRQLTKICSCNSKDEKESNKPRGKEDPHLLNFIIKALDISIQNLQRNL